MDEYMLVKRRKGESFEAIASALGVSGKAVRNRYRRMFPDVTDPSYIPRLRVHSAETRAAVVKMRKEGIPIKVVATRCGLRINQVTGIWNHWRDFEAPARKTA